MARRPPPKRAGHATGPRRIAGELLDVRGCAELLGVTEAMVRARVDRRLLPFVRWSGRVCFIRAHVLRFLQDLDGVSAEEALANVRARAGES